MNAIAIAFSWALLVTGSGCAFFRSGTLPPIERWPLSTCSHPRPTVRLAVKGEVVVNGYEERELLRPGVSQVGELGVRAYEESGLFRWAKGSVTKDADVYAWVEFDDRMGRDRGSLGLTLFTCFLYPHVARDTMTLRTTFKDRSGSTLGCVEVSETLLRVVQLFLAPLTPFTVTFTPEQDLVYDLHRATLAEAQRKGILH